MPKHALATPRGYFFNFRMKLIVDTQLPVKLCEILKQPGQESILVDALPKGDETSGIVDLYPLC